MSSVWPHVTLGSVITLCDTSVPVEQLGEVALAGVYSFGRGLFSRGTMQPGQTSYKTFNRLSTDDFVISQPKAWEGAIARVHPEFDGAYLSPVFPTFRVNRSAAEPAFIEWFCKREVVWEALRRTARGIGARRETVYPEQFLALEFPLPPVGEQRRIVARIDELAKHIDEANRLRRQSATDTGAVVPSAAEQVFSELALSYPPRNFGSYNPHVTSGPRNWSGHYEAGGLRFYRAQDISAGGTVIDDSKAYVSPPPGGQGRSAMLQVGDLMLVITGATVGRASVYRDGLEPGFVSQHVAICRLPPSEIEPEFALWGLRTRTGQAQLLGQRYGQGKPGLNLANIRSLSLPFPPLPIQRDVVGRLKGVETTANKLEQLQTDTAAELDALLPAILDRAFKGEL